MHYFSMFIVNPENFGFLVTSTDTYIIENGVYYMPCVAYSRAGRSITMMWKRPDGSIITSRNSTESISNITVAKLILEISCASFEDAMEYTCVATDGINTFDTSFNLCFTCEATFLPILMYHVIIVLIL